MSRIKIRIAIINITAGALSGGYRKYLRNVLPRMAKHDDVEAILCATPESIRIQDWFKPMANVRFVSCKPFRFMFMPLRYDNALLRKIAKFSPDVIFVPVERPFWFKNIPVVNMIQNMEPLICPYKGNPVSEILRNWLRIKSAQKAVNKADKIIAVSMFVKDFLINRWRIAPDKIDIVYHGIDFPEGNQGKRPLSIPKNWHKRFLFTAGSIRPARGLEDVIYALQYLRDTTISGLVIAGEANPNMIKYQLRLKRWLQTRNLSSRVCWTGNLNEKEMAWCYQSCSVFVMASRVESFGQIALEAMAHGCLCVSANNPCLPEIFADAAVYYPPKDSKALAEVIKTLLVWDDGQRKIMSEKAKKRACKFSWDVCAERTVAVLTKAVKRKQYREL